METHQRPELAPLLDHRVEEGEREDQLFPRPGLRAGLEVVVRDGGEGADEVRAHPLRRLVRQLDRALERGDLP